MTRPQFARRATRALGVALCLALAASLAACSDDDGATGAAPVAATPSVSCPAPLTTTAPATQRTVTSGGLPRTYNVWLPTGYTGTTPVPVVVDFHGAGGEAVEYETFSSMGAQAPARGYLLIAPQAVKGDAAGIGWKSPASGTTPNDVQFVADLLADVAADYCVDPARQYATGFSSGAAFTTYVSCTLDVWAAVAPLAGANLVQPCASRPPVPFMTFHGTTDSYVPYSSTVPALLPDPNQYYLGDVQTVVTQFAARNGCSTTPVDTEVVPTVTRRTFEGCPAGNDVELYSIENAGHTYPGGTPLPAESAEELGGQSQAIDAGKVILDFFDAHRRSTPPVLTPAPWTPATKSAAPSVESVPTITVTP